MLALCSLFFWGGGVLLAQGTRLGNLGAHFLAPIHLIS